MTRPVTPPSPVLLKRRPRLFIALLVVLALWIVYLLTLYFTTVYPLRHPG